MATYNKRGYKAPKPKEEKSEFDELDKVSEQDSTTAEVFNTLDTGAGKIEDWVQKNQKLLMGIIGGLILVVAIYFSYDKFIIEPKQEEAVSEMYQAEQYFSQAVNGVSSDSLFNLALNGGEGKMGFLK